MMQPHDQDETSAITYMVQVSRLPKSGLEVVIDADEKQCEALASAYDLQAVSEFIARFDVTSWRRGGVRVVGKVEAKVVQECSVTLEPVNSVIDEDVAATFLPEGSRLAVPVYSAEGEILLDPEGDDSPEIFSGDTINVGQLAEEFFAMGIDPYPRKQGASLDAGDTVDEKRGPLHDKLAALRTKL